MMRPRRILDQWMARWKSLPVVLKRRLLMGGLVLLGVDALFLILTYGPLLTWFAYQFRAEDPLMPSDAIVVLLANELERPATAAELYRQGLAPIVLMSPTSYVEHYRSALVRDGVPADAILILSGEEARNTHDEALRVRDYLRHQSMRRITVVTTAYHTARARWTFRKALFGFGLEVRMVAAEDRRFTEADWYMWDEGIRLYLLEAVKTAYYRLAY